MPCLHGPVELLLTGGQHKPCASFNQQACRNTTSVAEGKRKTPQKNASKAAKIFKKMPPFWGPKMDPFWGLPHSFFKQFCEQTNPKNGSIFGPVLGSASFIFKQFCEQTNPKNGSIFGPQNGGIFLNIFAPFDAIFCGVFRLPSATDVVFLHAC